MDLPPPVPPRPQRVSHLLHLLAAVLTGGLWLIPWIAFWAAARSANNASDAWYHAELWRYQQVHPPVETTAVEPG